MPKKRRVAKKKKKAAKKKPTAPKKTAPEKSAAKVITKVPRTKQMLKEPGASAVPVAQVPYPKLTREGRASKSGVQPVSKHRSPQTKLGPTGTPGRSSAGFSAKEATKTARKTNEERGQRIYSGRAASAKPSDSGGVAPPTSAKVSGTLTVKSEPDQVGAKPRADNEPLTKKEIRELRPWQMVALAARCAMRAIVYFQPVKSRDFDRQRADIIALDACVALAGLSANGEIRVDAPSVHRLANAADAAAARAARAAAYAAYAANAAAYAAAYAAYAAANAANAANAAATNAAYAAANAARAANAAARWDFYRLRDSNIADDGRVDRGFLQEPLWSGDDANAPESWVRASRGWVKLLREYNLVAMADWYRTLYRKHVIDFDAAKQRVEKWFEEHPADSEGSEDIPDDPDESRIEDQEDKDEQDDPDVGDDKDGATDPTSDAPKLDIIGGRVPADGDKPAKKDLLGRKALVTALTGMLSAKEQDTPFTLALLGDWGTGKTTVMKLLEKRLDRSAPEQFDFAWFNAWEYEHTKDISAGLAQEVVRGLIDRTNWLERQWLRVRFAWREYGPKSPWLMVLFPALALAAVLYVVAPALEHLPKSVAALMTVGGGAGGIALLVWGTKIGLRILEHPISVELRTYMRLGDYGEHLGLIPVLKRHIERLCEMQLGDRAVRRRRKWRYFSFTGHVLDALTWLIRGVWRWVVIRVGREARLMRWVLRKWSFRRGSRLCRRVARDARRYVGQHQQRGRLVVFVDDLDRCKPAYIAATFEAIRLVMDVPNVIVIVGIDPRIAMEGVSEQYKDLTSEHRSRWSIARDYLGKIIQLPITLSRPGRDEMNQFVTDRLFGNVEDDRRGKAGEVGVTAVGVIEGIGGEAVIPIVDGADQDDGGMPDKPKTPDDEDTPKRPMGFVVTDGVTDLALEHVEKLPPAPTPTPDRPQPAKVDLDVAMIDTPDDVRRFKELAAIFEFRNPRQLIRLRNSYRLLKLLARLRTDEIQIERTSDERIVSMLFWLEFVHESAYDRRAAYRSVVRPGSSVALSEVDEAHRTLVENARDHFRVAFEAESESATMFDRTERLVERVILPSGGPSSSSQSTSGPS